MNANKVSRKAAKAQREDRRTADEPAVVRLSRTMADKTGGYDHIVCTRRVSDERELVPTVVLGDVGS
jgi:hypothetical protein